MTGPDTEREQLETYHRQLALQQESGQVGMLRSGYLPTSPELLVEAGIRCVPLLESGDVDLAGAAYDRLEAILLKLRLSPAAPATRKAVEELEARLKEHHRQEARDTKFGVALLLVLAALIAGAVLLIVYWFTR